MTLEDKTRLLDIITGLERAARIGAALLPAGRGGKFQHDRDEQYALWAREVRQILAKED
mgnify:CR=1 FL=1